MGDFVAGGFCHGGFCHGFFCHGVFCRRFLYFAITSEDAYSIILQHIHTYISESPFSSIGGKKTEAVIS